MLEVNDIYRELQIHLDQFPVGFPATTTGIELKVLKHLFTEEEAIIATKLNWSYETIENIYEHLENKQISKESLEDSLNIMIKKGTIKYITKKGNKLYANLPLVVGIFEYQVDKLTKEFLEDFEEYLVSAFGAELLGTKISQFRTIPIQQSITPENYIANYDEVKQIIQNAEEPLTVANCVCRQSKDLYEQPCEKTDLRETCFYFGKTGQLFLDQGWARQVSKDAVLNIMQQAESDGLVFQSGNTLNPEFICSCCGCCCAILTKLKNLPRPSRVISSSFHAEINPDLCVGCGTCVEHCQINSIKLKENVANILLKRCIGCGVCVPACPEHAIQLKKKKEDVIPPRTPKELFTLIKDKKQQLRKK